ncbi:hypothetical protein DPMN_032637 [Dreissena polymorpha]|uniref:Uncharacterized protein n=1 Tax=Dreissena polymorpha TaxID=45954 RepID=A0A9D4M3A1_DREPO|nr:hypothetical protein DPMN_032637 [Dreissena polymorpha]
MMKTSFVWHGLTILYKPETKKGLKVVTDPLTLLIQETFRNNVLALKMWRTQIDHSTSFGYMNTFNGTTTKLYLPFF